MTLCPLSQPVLSQKYLKPYNMLLELYSFLELPMCFLDFYVLLAI